MSLPLRSEAREVSQGSFFNRAFVLYSQCVAISLLCYSADNDW